MPPRKSTRNRTPARAGANEAGTATGTSIGIENTRVRGAGLPASPSQYSTTYGSQAPNLAPRRVVAAPSGLRSVISNVVDNLERDNEEADDEIVRRGEAEAKATGRTPAHARAAKGRKASRSPERQAEDDDPVDLVRTGGEGSKRKGKEPVRPARRATETPEPGPSRKGKGKEPLRPVAEEEEEPTTGKGKGKAPVRPHNPFVDTPPERFPIPGGAKTPAPARQVSMPPPNTGRSFIEESSLFRDGEISTPAPARPARFGSPVAAGPARNVRAPTEPPPSVSARTKNVRDRMVRTAAPVAEFEDAMAARRHNDRQKNKNEYSFTIGWNKKTLLTGLGVLSAVYFSTFLLLRLTALFFYSTPTEYHGYPITQHGIQWHGMGWNGMKSNVAQFIPDIILHPTGCLADKDWHDWSAFWDSKNNDMDKLRKDIGLTNAAIEQLKATLPPVVLVTLDKNGRPVPTQEFWHAIKTAMFLDGNTNDARIVKWAEKNDALIQQIAGTYGIRMKDLIHKDEATKLFNDLSAKNAKANSKNDKSSSTHAPEVLVSQKEFIDQVQSEFKTHKADIAAEIKKMRTDIIAEVKSKLPDEIKAEITDDIDKSLAKKIDQRVKDAIGKIQIEKTANRMIQSHYKGTLQHKINWFTKHAGGVVVPGPTSPTYKVPVPRVKSPSWFGFLGNPGVKDVESIFKPWNEAGECWCATSQNGPADIVVDLGRPVMPEHIVMEHITPSATLYPDAMPKTIEVWALYQEHNVAKKLRTRTMTEFENVDTNLVDRGYALLDRFDYENTAIEKDDKVGDKFVHRLASADLLKEMGAATGQVLVRAVTNDGNKEFTCFYRISLFGEEGADFF